MLTLLRNSPQLETLFLYYFKKLVRNLNLHFYNFFIMVINIIIFLIKIFICVHVKNVKYVTFGCGISTFRCSFIGYKIQVGGEMVGRDG
jgi:hypothetical protein